MPRKTEFMLHAGGALAVFVIVYFYSPAALMANPEGTPPAAAPHGKCSPVMGDITSAHIEFHCEGIPPAVMTELNLENNRYLQERNAKQAERYPQQMELQQNMLILLQKNIEEQRERYQDLKQSIEQSRQADPANELLKKADAALEQGDFEKTAQLLEQLTAQEEKQVDRLAAYYYKTAQAHLLGYKPDRALPHQEKAWRYRPENFDYGFQYAKQLQTLNRYAKAQQVYEDLLAAQGLLAAGDLAQQVKLAQALNGAAIVYDYTNQRSKAEQAYRETLKIYRQLAEVQPAVYLADVAMTLNNLAALLADDDGRHGEAEQAFREALKIRRRLAETQPAAYLQHVADTLHNLAALLAEGNGRRGEAEQAYREALKIRRQLVDTQSAVHLSDVAMILNNLANLLQSDSGRRSEAEQAYREALKLYRQLAETQPTVYLQDVAGTLNNLASLLAEDNERRGEAEHAYREALKIRRQLAEVQPAVYLQDVATTLNNLGILLAEDSGRRGEAEHAYREALKIRRQLAETRPSVYGIDLANTLVAFSLFYLEAEEPAQASAFQKEAIQLLRPYAEQHPRVFGNKYALILFLSAYTYTAIEDLPAACDVLQAALQLAQDQGLQEQIKQLASEVCTNEAAEGE